MKGAHKQVCVINVDASTTSKGQQFSLHYSIWNGRRTVASSVIDFIHEKDPGVPRVLDGFVFAALFDAMSSAREIRVHGSVSENAIRNIRYISEAWTNMNPELYSIIDVNADDVVPGQSTKAKPGLAIQAFSGGVDSTFTALRHNKRQMGQASLRVGEAVMVQGFDVRSDNYSEFDLLCRRVSPVIDDLGMELSRVWTNLRHVQTSNWEHAFAGNVASVLHQKSHRNSLGLIASGQPYSRPTVSSGSSPALDFLWTGSEMEVIHDGAGFSRVDKIDTLKKFPQLIKALKVCWAGSNQSENCGVCEKCLRTRLDFAAVGILAPSCFIGPLDEALIGTINVSNLPTFTELESIPVFWRARQSREPRWLTLLEKRIEELRPNFS